MQPTFIGILALALAPVLVIARPQLLFRLGLFFAPFSGTAVVNVPALTFGLPLSQFCFAAYAASLLLHGRAGQAIRFTPGQLPIVLGLALFLLTLVASLIRPALDGTLAGVNVTMLVYVAGNAGIVLLAAAAIRDADALLAALRTQGAAVLFVSLWGFYQFLAGLAGMPYPSWLFNSSASDAAQLYGAVTGAGLVRVGSVAVEPSILVQSLAYYVAIAGTLTARGRLVLGRWQVAPLLAAIACMVLATSTTGFVGLAALAVLLLWQSTVRSFLLLAGAAAMLAGLLAIEPQLLAGVLESTLAKAGSWSFAHRTDSVFTALDQFAARPLLGWGWSTHSAHSLPAFILANTGLAGAAAMVLLLGAAVLGLVRRTGRPALRSARLPHLDLALALLNALLVSLVMQSAAGSTHVFPDFWILLGTILAFLGLPQLAPTQALRGRPWAPTRLHGGLAAGADT